MKKIFFLNTCIKWGGGENWTFQVAEYLSKKPNYAVTIGSIPESELYKRAETIGTQTKKVPIKSNLSFLNPVKIIQFSLYLRKEKIDVIFLNLSRDLKFGALSAKLAGVKKIIYRRGSAIPVKNRFYTRFLLQYCVTNIIANSLATKETILENTRHWLNSNKIDTIYNGIKLDEIKPTSTTTGLDIRKKYQIPADKIIMANVGRLNKQKGHKYLIEAIDILRKRFTNFHLLIIGQGELENEIKTAIDQLKLQEYITLIGFRDDIYSLLSQTDFLIHTALWEGFGYVIAEAMAVGKPVVSSNVSNISEIIVDGVTGYLAESKNPKDIAGKALKMLMNKNREVLGLKGFERIRSHFSFEKMMDKVEKLISK